jgi:Holliday junction resolvase RusA-like endonuclease
VEIKIEIPIKPVPHQSVRVTRSGRTYQPKRIIDYKKQVQEAVQGQLPGGFSCIKADTPIHITRLHYVFEYPKSFSKKKRNEDIMHFKHTKPDLHDNLNKALFDALEGIVWERDQNVVAMDDVKKYYATTNKIILYLQCLNY